MKYVEEYRDPELVAHLVADLKATCTRPLRIMEVCGTHTMAIFRHGIRSLLPPAIELVSGPGCPVCVTPAGFIDCFVDLAHQPDTVVATFGDMVRVPGTRGSLAQARALGGQVEVVYSPMDALEMACNRPDQEVVFLAVGFETTAPTIAATVLEAARRRIANFSIFPACKVMPPPLAHLLDDPDLALDGLLCPGHVSVIIGADGYRFLVERYRLACVVAGFEPADILLAILRLVRQVQEGRPRVENCYGRAVTGEGNVRARRLLAQVFVPQASQWRGLGLIPQSGLALRPEFGVYDITRKRRLKIREQPDPPGCSCGAVLKGQLLPPSCPLFGRRCTPSQPVGPCMVSSEGTCAAWYRYG